MRLFAAVLPPPTALRPLAVAVDGLQGLPGAGGLRWTGQGGWHLTLAFYGEVDEDAVPELTSGLAEAARHTAPFGLALRGGGQFGQGRTLWAGVRGDRDALRRLAGECAQAGLRAGVPGSGHGSYRPHLSLARSGAATDVGPLVAALDAFAGSAFTVAEAVLVRSELPGSGVRGDRPRYTPVARWALGAAG